MFRFLNLLLLFCFINNIGTATKPVRRIKGIKGGSVTLPCEDDRDISFIVLSRRTKNILVCEKEKCESENGRVFKEGSCNVVIEDLILRDAGKYILRVYYSNDQKVQERQILEYQLHIHDEISVKAGDELKLDVLMFYTDKVEHQSRSSSEWMEVWRTGHGVISDRLTDHNGNLTILHFKATDAGTYRVLDYNNEILITVTVTVSESDLHQRKDDDKPVDPEQRTLILLITVLCAFGLLVVLLTVSIWKRKHQNTSSDRWVCDGVPMEERENRRPVSSSDVTGDLKSVLRSEDSADQAGDINL